MDRSRAHWNLGLEKALVELLHNNNNDCYRGQNGWSTDACNGIVKSFHQKFKHISFSRQHQDKEKELKREYRMLKEARQQSGASWDDKLCMIVADAPVWANNITVISKNYFLLAPNYHDSPAILCGTEMYHTIGNCTM